MSRVNIDDLKARFRPRGQSVDYGPLPPIQPPLPPLRSDPRWRPGTSSIPSPSQQAWMHQIPIREPDFYLRDPSHPHRLAADFAEPQFQEKSHTRHRRRDSFLERDPRPPPEVPPAPNLERPQQYSPQERSRTKGQNPAADYQSASSRQPHLPDEYFSRSRHGGSSSRSQSADRRRQVPLVPDSPLRDTARRQSQGGNDPQPQSAYLRPASRHRSHGPSDGYRSESDSLPTKPPPHERYYPPCKRRPRSPERDSQPAEGPSRKGDYPSRTGRPRSPERDSQPAKVPPRKRDYPLYSGSPKSTETAIHDQPSYHTYPESSKPYKSHRAAHSGEHDYEFHQSKTPYKSGSGDPQNASAGRRERGGGGELEVPPQEQMDGIPPEAPRRNLKDKLSPEKPLVLLDAVLGPDQCAEYLGRICTYSLGERDPANLQNILVFLRHIKLHNTSLRELLKGITYCKRGDVPNFYTRHKELYKMRYGEVKTINGILQQIIDECTEFVRDKYCDDSNNMTKTACDKFTRALLRREEGWGQLLADMRKFARAYSPYCEDRLHELFEEVKRLDWKKKQREQELREQEERGREKLRTKSPSPQRGTGSRRPGSRKPQTGPQQRSSSSRPSQTDPRQRTSSQSRQTGTDPQQGETGSNHPPRTQRGQSRTRDGKQEAPQASQKDSQQRESPNAPKADRGPTTPGGRQRSSLKIFDLTNGSSKASASEAKEFLVACATESYKHGTSETQEVQSFCDELERLGRLQEVCIEGNARCKGSSADEPRNTFDRCYENGDKLIRGVQGIISRGEAYSLKDAPNRSMAPRRLTNYLIGAIQYRKEEDGLTIKDRIQKHFQQYETDCNRHLEAARGQYKEPSSW